LYPEVIDKSNVGARFIQPLFLTIGVEGQADAGGDAVVGQIYQISRPSDSDTKFGAASSLGLLVKYLLTRGISPVFAVASVKSGTAPTLVQRQAAWQALESNKFVRIRMTDDVTQATLVALAQSCDNASLIYHKQVGFGGMAAGTTKAGLLTAASAIASKRFVLVGPGVLDNNGTLLSGNFGAAAVAAEVAKNQDIADDLDRADLSNFTGIELGATGQPIFSERVVSGAPVNDFEDLLQGGVSPLQLNDLGNGIQITHLRTTWTTDSTFDALETRLIVDQLFIDVRDYCINNLFLRRGNTPANRKLLQAAIAQLLTDRNNWISPVTQPDGTPGYGVSVTASTDLRQVIIAYQGIVQRNIQTIVIDATLSVPV
jgi:hypothetical protein